MISHVVILSGFRHRSYLVRSIRQLSFIFGIDHICAINHVVVLIGFHHSRYLIRSIMIVQYYFQHRLHLHDWSRRCLVWFLSQMALGPIDYDNSVSFQHRLHLTEQVPAIQFWFRHRLDLYNQSRPCLVQFLSQTKPDSISHRSSVLFLTSTAFLRIDMQQSYLVFVIVSTRFDQSRQFSIIFQKINAMLK